MKKAEIDALVQTHGGRCRPVAFLHVLRQTSLDDDDHAFLEKNAGELAAADLLRWRARTPTAKRPPILVGLAKMAETSPAEFEHEVMNAPGLSFDEREWETLADLLQGKVSPALHARIVARDAGPRAPAATPAAFFAPAEEGLVDLASMFDLEGAGSDGGRTNATGGDEGSLFGAGSLGDQLGLDFGDDAGEPLFADPFAGLSVEAGLDKLLKSERGDELAMLLEWLEARGVEQNVLLGRALVNLAHGSSPVSAPFVAGLAKRLTSKDAFFLHGIPFLAALIERRAFAELQEVLAQGADLAGGDVERVHASFGGVLLDSARMAIRSKDEPRAQAALAALSCLDVPAEVSGRFKLLKTAVKRASCGPAIVALVDLNARLARDKGKNPRSSPLEGMIAAVHALADAKH
jgi:hypothetical protein